MYFVPPLKHTTRRGIETFIHAVSLVLYLCYMCVTENDIPTTRGQYPATSSSIQSLVADIAPERKGNVDIEVH
jgi:hypothetical protein